MISVHNASAKDREPEYGLYRIIEEILRSTRFRSSSEGPEQNGPDHLGVKRVAGTSEVSKASQKSGCGHSGLDDPRSLGRKVRLSLTDECKADSAPTSVEQRVVSSMPAPPKVKPRNFGVN